jgi:hypothetical protein
MIFAVYRGVFGLDGDLLIQRRKKGLQRQILDGRSRSSSTSELEVTMKAIRQSRLILVGDRS